MFPEVRKQGAEMVESFKDACVVDGRSVEQDAENDEGESGDSKGAVDEHPNELSILLEAVARVLYGEFLQSHFKHQLLDLF